MEDYAGACTERYRDVEALLQSNPMRSTAAVHLGGIAVECQIKALVLRYHRICVWNEKGERAQDAFFKKPIARPGHNLVAAVKQMTRLYEKAKADPLFLKHLDGVMHPVGSRDADFIGVRYSATALESNALQPWQKSLDYVRGWLKKNEVM
jgi:hypothetical protein